MVTCRTKGTEGLTLRQMWRGRSCGRFSNLCLREYSSSCW